ncbi:PLP-dependent aminotransferase family protein [Mesobacterium pallidum]|uniref:aminotransferase-like domain-containing protein n=1 Tax=Mesobacterium pallidum TaxID=2872037 RepID=UPI001EE1FCDF|nr:PLP-dependent aminotransferase family protein [Mesobacterium pallidum]
MGTILSGALVGDLGQAITAAGRAKYRGLAEGLERAILGGGLPAGTRLPPVRDLSWRLGVTPGTVARAYSTLTDSGLLTAGVGRGTFVAERSVPPAPPVANPATLAPSAWLPQGDGEVSLRTPMLPDLGQSQLIREHLAGLAAEMPTDRLMNYPGRDSDLPARQAFRRWMGAAPIGPLTDDDLVTAHGGQSGIVMALQCVLRGPGPVVLVDELTYSGYRRAAELARATCIPVPWDREGPDPQALETLGRLHGAQAFCTSAEVCNPTTRATTPERRQQIAEVAQRLHMHVIDDDCYRIGPHRAPAYRALLPELGWYVTSPSKVLTPALRIGFVAAPEGWGLPLARIAAHNSFGVSSPLTDLFVRMVDDPRMPALAEAVRQRINDDLRIAVNHLGGHALTWQEDVPFLWLDLPQTWRAESFARAAAAQKVGLKTSDEFAARDARPVHAVRIALNGQVSTEIFEHAVSRLGLLLGRPPENLAV